MTRLEIFREIAEKAANWACSVSSVVEQKGAQQA
jgi:hypothetical protein